MSLTTHLDQPNARLDRDIAPLADRVRTRRRDAEQLLDLLTGPAEPTSTPTPMPTPAQTERRRRRRVTAKTADTATVDIPTPARSYPTGRRLSDDPVVSLFDDFVEDIEGEALMAAAKSDLKRGKVTGDKTAKVSRRRTGRVAWVPHDHTPAISGLAERISQVVGFPLTHAEDFQVVHYGQGQEYGPHQDGWAIGTERGDRYTKRGGQRLVTCLFYLNDVAEGGGTCFPRLDMEILARRGRMVIFHNCRPDGTKLHPRSQHGGLRVERGEKWAANLWFRERSHRWAGPRSGQFSNVF